MSGAPAIETTDVAPAGVTVAICNYQGVDYLAPCIESVLAQTHPVDEILVVDNASTDGGVALVRERFPMVRVIERTSNDGPAPARNDGMRAAAHRWVLALDNDVVLEPDTVEKLVAARDAGDFQVFQPRSVFSSEPTRVHYDGAELHYLGLFSLRNFYAKRAEAEGEGVLEVGGVVSLALFLDRDAVLEVGGYDPVYFILFEDLDLSYRLRARGLRLAVVEDAIVHHREGTQGISYREGPRYPASRTRLHSRNRWLYVLQNYSAWTIILGLPGHILYEGASFAFAVAEGNLWAYCTGKWDFLRLVPRALERRRSNRKGYEPVSDGELLVGGPLTITPGADRGGTRGALSRGLSKVLAGYWHLVKGLS